MGIKSHLRQVEIFVVLICLLASVVPSSLYALDDWASVKREIHKDLGSKDLIVQLKGLDRLAGQDNFDAAKFIVDLAEKKSGVSASINGYATEILSTYRSANVQKFLADYMKKDPFCQIYVFKAISQMGIPETKQIFTDIVTGPKKNNKDFSDYYAIAVRAMGSFPDQDESMVNLLLSKLRENEPQAVRKAACEALGGIKSSSIISGILPYFGDQILEENVIISLTRLTGQDFGGDREKWVKWVGEHQGDNMKLAFLSREEYAKLMEKKKAAAMLAENQQPIKETSFYGIKLSGKNIYFVLDRSGSMNTVDVSVSRISQLRIEMGNVVEKLESSEKNYSFGVYFFGGLIRFPMHGLCSNKSKNLDRMKRFLDSIGADGHTPMRAALEYTFDEVAAKNNIDTVYLLSDGEPTDATPDQIISLVYERNIGSYIKINTVSLGQKSDLLKRIAEITGGEYVSVP